MTSTSGGLSELFPEFTVKQQTLIFGLSQAAAHQKKLFCPKRSPPLLVTSVCSSYRKVGRDPQPCYLQPQPPAGRNSRIQTRCLTWKNEPKARCLLVNQKFCSYRLDWWLLALKFTNIHETCCTSTFLSYYQSKFPAVSINDCSEDVW